ncbi:MAG: PEP-CTERM sorting domain-containing protein [Phycisphaerales bacterium]
MHKKAIRLTAAIIILVQTSCFSAASFQGIGYLPGSVVRFSSAEAISADGSTIVGGAGYISTSNKLQFHAFRWTSNSGMTDISDLPEDAYSCFASDVSGDGSVIVGINENKAFIWTSANGTTHIETYPDSSESSSSIACDISFDGTIVAGTAAHGTSYNNLEAFRWTAEEGITGLGFLPNRPDNLQYGPESRAKAISYDGSVIAGCSNFQAFRWTTETGMVGIGDLQGGDFDSYAEDISADGSVIIGTGTSDLGAEAFRWTQETGIVGLGDFEGGDFESHAYAVSADGSIIIGTSVTDFDYEAFYWTAETGMLKLKDLLTEKYALDLSGWRLTDAYGISADGTKIVGYGFNPQGFEEGWIVTIPEPATILLLTLGGLVFRKSF